MAYKRKTPVIKETFLDEPTQEYPYNQFPFNVLDNQELDYTKEMIDLYQSVLSTKHPSQLNGYYELGKSYPNYKNLIGVLNEHIKTSPNTDITELCKQVLISIGFIQITK